MKPSFLDLSALNPLWQQRGIDFPEGSTRVLQCLKKFQLRNQGFPEILDDRENIAMTKAFIKEKKEIFTEIVLLGIGGSSLGIKALREALQVSSKTPALHILDNIDPDFLERETKMLDLKKTFFIVTSKSGSTTETIAQYFYFRELLEKEGLNPNNHFVFISGQKGFLRDEAEDCHIPIFDVPESVGGRFSVLSSVGLLPADCIKIDIENLLKGAKESREKFFATTFEKNEAFQLAWALFLLWKEGKTGTVLWSYSSLLRSFGDWFTQLLAESTGKINHAGEAVGFTPIPAIGATDQHSLLQLFAQGPNDKSYIFIVPEKFTASFSVPENGIPDRFSHIRGRSFAEILTAEATGTADALAENHRPVIKINIPQMDAYHVGKLIFFFEGVIAFLGEFLNIDAFDQPGVERSKKLTREYLLHPSEK